MKKIKSIAFVAAFAAIAGYGVFVNQKTDEMSELTLANIEALAQSESSSGGCRFRIDAICSTSNKDHYLYRNN